MFEMFMKFLGKAAEPKFTHFPYRDYHNMRNLSF